MLAGSLTHPPLRRKGSPRVSSRATHRGCRPGWRRSRRPRWRDGRDSELLVESSPTVAGRLDLPLRPRRPAVIQSNRPPGARQASARPVPGTETRPSPRPRTATRLSAPAAPRPRARSRRRVVAAQRRPAGRNRSCRTPVSTRPPATPAPGLSGPGAHGLPPATAGRTGRRAGSTCRVPKAGPGPAPPRPVLPAGGPTAAGSGSPCPTAPAGTGTTGAGRDHSQRTRRGTAGSPRPPGDDDGRRAGRWSPSPPREPAQIDGGMPGPMPCCAGADEQLRRTDREELRGQMAELFERGR